ncbi:MAG: ThaI family type II restriction endonuclease [Aquificaceae bacterium]|nr:ThaI family type II restriction endonuclease [Aquificaceae bacterium]
MADLIAEIFKDEESVRKINTKLPYLFKLAELEVSKGGRAGMEVGTLREKVIISFLMYRFGINSVKEPPVNYPEADVVIEGHDIPISIKTKTGKSYSGVKLSWTVDWKKVDEFYRKYEPSTDMLFVFVNWGAEELFCYIPQKIQLDVLNTIGKERYIKKPKQGTNPRGVEISAEALELCVEKAKEKGYSINISWEVPAELLNYSPYTRWIELWAKD